MRNKVLRSSFSLMFILMVAVMFLPIMAYATNTDDEQKYYIGKTVNTGNDNGYSENNKIAENDPHFSWTLGNFLLPTIHVSVKMTKVTPFF